MIRDNQDINQLFRKAPNNSILISFLIFKSPVENEPQACDEEKKPFKSSSLCLIAFNRSAAGSASAAPLTGVLNYEK